MKTKLLFFGMLLINLSFGQGNFSLGPVNSPIQPVPVTTPPTSAPNEIFRFQPGNVTQLDLGTNFNFTNSRWFSMGKVVTGTNTAYGLRFQLPNKALTLGYQSVTNLNPRIEWIGTGAALGNLEFRAGNSFTSTVSTLVATMLNTGITIFGNPLNVSNTAKVGIANNNQTGLSIRSTGSFADGVGFEVDQNTTNNQNIGGVISCSGSSIGIGMVLKASSNNDAIGLQAFASNGGIKNIGVQAQTIGTAPFEAAIFGKTPNTGNRFAGYFDGAVFSTIGFSPSDVKLKSNVKLEAGILEKISKLQPVTYNYNDIKEMNLPSGIQHGFIAQEIAAVFPELTQDINKPVFDNEGKSIGTFDFKSVNYTGLISVLTAGIKELNDELKAIKQELAVLKDTKVAINSSLENTNKVFMEQNIPNPFTDQTTIRYQLPVGVNNANIMVMDLNGTLIKSYQINKNQSEINIKSSEIGKGLFIYSLVQNGQELITKKMIIN